MLVTIVGKIFCWSSGVERFSPSRTRSCTRERASEIRELLMVPRVIVSASRIGTPDARSVPKVRVNLATVDFITRSPIFGSLRAAVSHTLMPIFVLKKIFTKRITPTMIRPVRM